MSTKSLQYCMARNLNCLENTHFGDYKWSSKTFYDVWTISKPFQHILLPCSKKSSKTPNSNQTTRLYRAITGLSYNQKYNNL